MFDWVIDPLSVWTLKGQLQRWPWATVASRPFSQGQGLGEESAEKTTSGLVAEGWPEARSQRQVCDGWLVVTNPRGNQVSHRRVWWGRGLDGTVSGTISLQKWDCPCGVS